ncbi:MAG TPA: hypothetical protein DF296_09695 [Candidatus Margulisbacteria bacterium]|nr:hypothetical protein [Candidatus Margulisiibacteriota bacterium]HCT85459.1 hypothetical protein [Candidatus Margulisiibacteriota bacterium]
MENNNSKTNRENINKNLGINDPPLTIGNLSASKEKRPDSIKTILFVDDHKFIIRNLRNKLEAIGYKVYSAYNGQEAVDEYFKIKPDIVFLDVVMPVKDGITALKEIKRIVPTSKIVMMSGLGFDDEIAENIKILGLVEKGADGFLIKPVNVVSINKKVWDLAVNS